MRGHGFSELHGAAQPLQNLCHWWQCRRRNFSHVKIFNTVTFQKEDPGKQLPCVLKLDVINKLTRISTAKPRNVLLITPMKTFYHIWTCCSIIQRIEQFSLQITIVIEMYLSSCSYSIRYTCCFQSSEVTQNQSKSNQTKNKAQ